MRTEEMLFWAAVVLYGVSTFSYIFGVISQAEKLFSVGLVAALAGFVPHLASIAVRWMSGGVSPFITTAESITFGTLVSVALFLVLQASTKKLRPLGVLVVPVCFVLLGWAGTLMGAAASQLAPALQSYWLWVHIIGATTGFGSVLIAAGLGLLYLLKARHPGGFYERLPSLPDVDNMSYRYVLAGFIMYGGMIVSGAFWANQVKGSFWNWDPVEVWSLISWLTYGVYLHLRITFGWRGQRLAVYALFALAAMVVSYWGVPFTMETFHSGFRVEH